MSSKGLKVFTSGSGRPLILLHGFLESSAIWQKLEFPDRRVIKIDLPGHGASDDLPYSSMVELAQMIRELLQDLEIDEFDVVGHSMGGYVALALKSIDPNCDRVILLNANFWEDSAEKKEDRLRVASLVKTHKMHFLIHAIPGLFNNPEYYDAIVKELLEQASHMPASAIERATLAMRSRNSYSQLVHDCPKEISIIQGTHDQLTTREAMLEQLKGFTNAYVEVPTSHMAWAEDPNRCVSEIVRLLE